MSSGVIGVLLHPGENHVGAAIAEAAQAQGWSSWSAVDDVAAEIAKHARETDLLITVGGDGTFLLGARLAAQYGIPVLGANRGRLGFLTDVDISKLPHAIDDFINGRHHVIKRRLLHASAPKLSAIAVNDIVIKSRTVSVVSFTIKVNSEELGRFSRWPRH